MVRVSKSQRVSQAAATSSSIQRQVTAETQQIASQRRANLSRRRQAAIARGQTPITTQQISQIRAQQKKQEDAGALLRKSILTQRKRQAVDTRARFNALTAAKNAQSAAIRQSQPSPIPFSSNSKFIIIGGKAVPKTAVGSFSPVEQDPREVVKSVQSNFVISAPQKTGDPKIDAVFAGQQAATRRVAETFVQNRLAALNAGASTEEAAIIAQRQTAGLSKQQANAINTALQKEIIEEKEGQIRLAEELIKKQTTEGEAGDLDNLAGQLANAQPKAITTIPIQLDAEGNDIAPRRTKLTIENAILTGNKLEDLELDITVDKNAPVFDRGGFVSADLSTGELFVEDLTNVFPTGILDLQGLTSEEIIRQTSSGQFSGVQALVENVRGSRIIQGDTNLLEVSKLTPTVAQEEFQTPIRETIFDTINPADLVATETPEGLIIFTTKTGEEIFRGSPEEAASFLNRLFTNQFNASKEQQESFAALLEELRRRISLGQGLAEILEQLLNLLGSLPKRSTQQGNKQGQTGGQTPQVQQSIFDQIISFFTGIFAAIIALFTGGASQ